MQSLSEALASPVGKRDNEEKARRDALRELVTPPLTKGDAKSRAFLRKLVGIIVKLKPLSEQHKIVKFLKNADDAKTLNSAVQALAIAVTDYQVCATNTASRAV